MKRILRKTIQLVILSILPTLAILHFPSVGATGAEQQKQARDEFRAMLIDSVSKKPVQSARIILARKKEGKLECTIDTSLTGVSNENGEVRLQNVKPGEYVVFYNVSGIIHVDLNGKVVNYARPVEPGPPLAYTDAISRSLGPLIALKGSEMGIFDGQFSIKNGHMYAVNFDLAMIISDGKLLKVRIPSTGSVPLKIEIHTDIGK